MSGLLDPAFLARLEKLDFTARKILAGEFRGDVRTRRRGIGALFREHKRYTQGDDLRFLDWNVYSRLGELLVKEFESEENLNLLLLLDASGSMAFGEHEKFSFARRVAAALGFVALNRLAVVDLATLPDGAARRRSFFGRAAVPEFFGALDGVKAEGALDIDAGVRTVLGARRGRGLAVIVSDFFAESGYQSAFRFLQHSGLRVAAVHVLDRLDLHPGLSGRLRLEDIETGRRMSRTVTPAMLAAYEEEVRSFCDGVERYCRGRDVAYVRLDTSWTLEKAIRSLLLRGGVLA